MFPTACVVNLEREISPPSAGLNTIELKRSKIMNVKKQWIIAALSLGLMTGVQAQNVEGKAKVGEAEGKANVTIQDREKNKDHTYQDRSERKTGISKFNKASDLIGMNVKNSQAENLGEIKDLVVDLQTGKISYAVLSVGGFLGIGEKYIAVPPSVFMTDKDDGKLLLNADKAKLQQAPGFAKNNWPDVENPAWGAFWGVAGDTRIESGTDRYQKRDRDLNKDRNLNRDRDLNRDLNRDRNQDRNPTPQP
jgi:hypothetical protein